jgi:hypothetical protein
MAEVPFAEKEFGNWRKEPSQFVEEHYPGLTELLARHDENPDELLRSWGYIYWSIDKAKEKLGYQPKYNFPEFFSAMKEGNYSHYPYSNLPWWGM